MSNVKLDGPELWEIVFSATQGGGDEITEAQYSDIAETINAVFIAAKDAEIAALKAKMDPLVGMLTGLVAESGRDVGWGEEDSFRMGEWFEANDLAAIESARAVLKGESDADA